MQLDIDCLEPIDRPSARNPEGSPRLRASGDGEGDARGLGQLLPPGAVVNDEAWLGFKYQVFSPSAEICQRNATSNMKLLHQTLCLDMVLSDAATLCRV